MFYIDFWDKGKVFVLKFCELLGGNNCLVFVFWNWCVFFDGNDVVDFVLVGFVMCFVFFGLVNGFLK